MRTLLMPRFSYLDCVMPCLPLQLVSWSGKSVTSHDRRHVEYLTTEPRLRRPVGERRRDVGRVKSRHKQSADG